MKKFIKWLLIGGGILIVLFCVIFGAFSGGKEEPPTTEQSIEEQVRQTIETSNKQTAQAIPTSTQEIISTLEPLEQIKNLLADELGESNRDVQRLTSLDWDVENSEILVTFTADDNFTEDMIFRGIQMDIESILRIIQISNMPLTYKTICTVATFPLVDVYGNSTESNVVIATYSHETLNKVNWDNFITDNIYSISIQEYLFIHPSFQP